MGKIKKVAICKVKLYELFEGKNDVFENNMQKDVTENKIGENFAEDSPRSDD